MASPSIDVLAGLRDDEAARVRALGSRLRLSAGETLFDIGDEARSFFIVESGRLALTLPMAVRDEQRDVLVEERSPGQSLGWSALVPPHKFTLKAVSAVDAEVLAVSREDLCAHLAARPAVGYVVMQNVSAIVGQRLQVVQTMWLREFERAVGASRS